MKNAIRERTDSEHMKQKQWWKEDVVYQIYPKSFYDSDNDGSGDIKGITQKVPYLDELGITMLWICPIFTSPMVDNGYDISDYQPAFPNCVTIITRKTVVTLDI